MRATAPLLLALALVVPSVDVVAQAPPPGPSPGPRHGARPVRVLPAQHAPRPAADDADRIERLAALGRLWGRVKHLHPSLPARPGVDWDGALVRAIPAVRAAASPQAYRAAVQTMLDELGDPLTRVEGPGDDAGSASEAGPLSLRTTEDGVLVVSVGDYFALTGAESRAALAQFPEAVAGARAVVLDLRSPVPTEGYGRAVLGGSLAAAQRLLTTDTLLPPGERRRVHYGLESPGPFSSGQYRSGWFVRSGTPIVPAADARDVPVVFVMNRHAGDLPLTVPLQAAGRARIVYEGDPARHRVGPTATVPLADGLTARVREAERVLPDGRSGAFRPDVVVPASTGGDDEALERALELARAPAPSAVAREPLPAVAPTRSERAYRDMAPPDLEHRLLAAFRLWSAVEHFYPYKDLLDHDWGAVLPEVIPVFEGATDARAYALAVAGLAKRIQDSHAYVGEPAGPEPLLHPGVPPIRVRMVEGLPVVTALRDDEAAAAAGVRVGQVVLSVDGVPAGERLDEVAALLSTSTPQSLMDRAALSFMHGPVGSMATLRLRDADGGVIEARLERRREDYTTLYHRERTGEVVRELGDGVGYVDLDRLTLDMVDPMFERLADARAIVFDMRGYPYGTVWAIAPRLAAEPAAAAVFHTPMPGHGSPHPASERFVQVVEPAPDSLRWRGRTVMLVDERTVSQAEHTGLWLRAANATTFVGGPTAGANGEITSVSLPGGYTVGFTGQAVRHPDGRRLQRVGLIPDVEARPTLAGVRAGRDEVLEAALRLLGRDVSHLPHPRP